MFYRKKKELNKTSVSKKNLGGNFGSHNSTEQPTRDGGLDVPPPFPASLQDPQAPPCPTTTCLLHPRLATATSPPPVLGACLRRPTALSRHASAAGFPLQAAGAWAFSKTQGKGASLASSPTTEASEVGIEVEDIPSLLRDVACFAEAVEKLKEMVLGEDRQIDNLSDRQLDRRDLAQECLGEVLRVLRQVIGAYPLLNTVETLTAAGTLISKVKGFSYKDSSDMGKQDFEKAIETMAVAFSSSVSELLMGEVDSSTLLSLPLTERSRSMENLYGLDSAQAKDCQGRSDQQDCCMLSGEQVDLLLQCSEGGVDSALSYAKAVSRYLKDIISYVEKRTALEMEFAKGLQRLCQSCKQSIAQPQMPFFSIYSLALEQDLEQSVGVQQTTGSIHTVLQPLMQCKQEHERRRRELGEQWQRAQRKLTDAESGMRKTRGSYMIRCEEYDKARGRAEEELQGGAGGLKALDRKKRLEEEARTKAEEAEAVYRACISEAEARHQEREQTKGSTLRQIHDVIRHTDHTLRSCTVSYYQLLHMQTAVLPVHYQTLCESTKLYEPGQQYAAHVRHLHKSPEDARHLYTSTEDARHLYMSTEDARHLSNPEPAAHYHFEPYSSNHLSGHIRHNSSNTDVPISMETTPPMDSPISTETTPPTDSPISTETTPPTDSPISMETTPPTDSPISTETTPPTDSPISTETTPTTDEDGGAEDGVTQRCGQGHQSHKSWPSTMKDSDCLGGVYGQESSSTGHIPKASEEEHDGNVTSFEQGTEPEIAVPTGPFRNVGMSKAAKTHRLRKLRTPAKCRGCNSYVYFQGAECEECYLACHRRCLENLAIQCGHKKLQGRLLLFGRDFTQGLGDPDGVPLVIRKCITEIESRALRMKGIYRVNGVKTRVEKLCQAFENGKELVELSQAFPHDISNMLKLYLRQLPEPILPFHLYQSLMGLAKESLRSASPSPDGGEVAGAAVLADLGAETPLEVLTLVHSLRELMLTELPQANTATLRYIAQHLRRVCECEQENKMSPSNLGIVFGPTLMRPRPSGATVALSSLVDYPHQARIVETLIVFYSTLFHDSPYGTPVSPLALSQDSGGEEGRDCGGGVQGRDEGNKTDLKHDGGETPDNHTERPVESDRGGTLSRSTH
ncbi:rho GTPase-activating protein 45 isoform X2 [Oncorhynchus tshawytscha]|uniref:rho GTPase-activating protein 45 isoform X2 n=1 Tax=Oncorhynchus tshawytscha TaxID=74940 RepID=UPI001C3C8C50|nr:rho GTPase-activating protein 45 isoform X2 [Oncorhynchus tshawytscha]